MTAQLRIYTIKDGLLDEWVEKFHEEIVPPRLQYDFEVVGAWTHADQNQFVWIVAYNGPLGFQQAVDRYYESPERSSISFDPDNYIDHMDVRLLEDT